MTLYDFSSKFYLKDHYDTIVLIDYFKMLGNVTQKEINEKMDIPKSNFRRAQMKGFASADDILQKMAAYFEIPFVLEEDIYRQFDSDFSNFYTCICFSMFERSKPYFDHVMDLVAKHPKSILILAANLAQLIYYVSEINYTNKIDHAKIEASIAVLEYFVDKMSNEHRFLYYEYMTAYNGIKKDSEKVVHYARLTVYMGSNYPEFEPTANYHVSFAYSMIGDFINGLIYANKALPKLEEQLNYNKAVFCRMNIATYYKKLGNYDEALVNLKKNMIYLNFNEIPRLNRVTYVSYADCMLAVKNYAEALTYFLKIEDEYTKKPDYESLMSIYCMYRLGQDEQARDYYERLEEAHRKGLYPEDYLSLARFVRAYYTHVTSAELEQAYQTAEAFMPNYRYRGYAIQDIATELFHATAPKKGLRPQRASGMDDYLG